MVVATWAGVTVVGVVVFVAWLGSAVFLWVHATSPWRTRPAGIAVMVMAVVTCQVLGLATLRSTFGIILPDWLRGLIFLEIAVGVWWKAITALRYRYWDLHDRRSPTPDPRVKES